MSESLDLLHQRGQDLQSMLPNKYNSLLLLHDFILRAVRKESFYEPLRTSTILDDRNKLETRRHQCIQKNENVERKVIQLPDKIVPC